MAAPAVAWFDSVLADVGDGQSLQQSLSTFSGHIRRVRAILAAVTPRSLVLLDEVPYFNPMSAPCASHAYSASRLPKDSCVFVLPCQEHGKKRSLQKRCRRMRLLGLDSNPEMGPCPQCCKARLESCRGTDEGMGRDCTVRSP